MAKVFISHAGADSAVAAEVHQWLVGEGHEVFLDRDLREGIGIGEEWEARLHERLRWADALVCLVTAAYVASVWCTAELSIARSRGSRLLPVRAEAGVNHPLLKALQHTDLTTDPARARRLLVEGLRRVDAAGGGGWPDGTSPYPGLRAFDSELQRVFFGRSGDVEELVERLRSPAERAIGALLLVVGPSGCGKSSLVRAGLLPSVADEAGWWTLRAFVPGADPLTNLARELAATAKDLGLRWNVADLRGRLLGTGLVPIADELLLAAPGGQRRRLLVVIDQFEELLTRTPPEDLAKFAAVVRGALSGPVQVVATLRPEFLDRVLIDPELATLPTRTHLVQPLRRDALREVIEGPARVAGIQVSDSLVNELVADTDTGDALPLLAFTLAQLAQGVGRGGELSSTRYREIGGVQGALVRQADAALAEAMDATGRDRDQVIESLLVLVTVDENGRPARWSADRAELAGDVATELDAFVARRLLVTDSADDKVVISVAHEAFLSAWPPLREAIADRASALRARRAIEHAADEWDDAGRPPERLWERGQLAAALSDTGAQLRPAPDPADTTAASSWLRRLNKELVVDRVLLTEKARRFLTAAIRRDRQRRRRAVSILSALLGLAMIAAIFAAVQSRTAQEQRSVAEEQRRIAIARQLTAQADETRATDAETSLRLGIAADRIHPDRQNRAGLVNSLMATRYAGNVDAGLFTGDTPAFTTDGRLMAVQRSDDDLMLWDVGGQGALTPIGKPIEGQGPNGEEAHLGRPQFSADGRTLLAVQTTSVTALVREIVRWDVSDPSSPKVVGDPFVLTGENLADVLLSPDGRLLVTTTNSPVTLTVWDVSGPTPRRLNNPVRVGDMRLMTTFLAGGRTLLTASANKSKYSAVLWDVTLPNGPRALGKPIAFEGVPAYSEATNTLATRDPSPATGSASLWDLADPARPRKLPGVYAAQGSVDWMQFSPDGRMIAVRAGGSKNTSEVVLWNLSNRARPEAYSYEYLMVSDEQLARLVFLPGRPRVVTISDASGEVALWDIGNPRKPQRVGAPFKLSGAEGGRLFVLPDGQRLASVLPNGSVNLWDLTDAGEPRLLSELATSDAILSLDYFPDSTTLSAVRTGGVISQWNIADRSAPRALSPGLRAGPVAKFGSVVFSPRDRLMAYESPDGIVVADAADLNRRSVLKKPFLPGDQGGDHAEVLGFSPQGTVLAISVLIPRVGSRVSLWDVRDPAQVKPLGPALRARGLFPPEVDFFPDGRTLVQGLSNGAYLTDISDPGHPRELGAPVAGHRAGGRSVAVSPDGQLMATGSDDQTAILWDVSDPSRPRQLGLPLIGHEQSVTELAFSPDGSILATGDDRGGILLWDLADPNSPRQLGTPLKDDYLGAMTFSPDGRTLVTGSSIGGRVHLRDLSGLYELREQAADRACERSNGGLTRDQWALYVVGLPYQDTCAP